MCCSKHLVILDGAVVAQFAQFFHKLPLALAFTVQRKLVHVHRFTILTSTLKAALALILYLIVVEARDK